MTSLIHTRECWAYCIWKILTKKLLIIKLYSEVLTIKLVLFYQILNT